jgi:LDH2 family malate/lactate/ureidoglycolate dehydrogenase
MATRTISVDPLRLFVEQVFSRIGYSQEQANDAADVLIWASLRGVDTHGIRNLKSYYVDRTRAGILRPHARIRVEHETQQTACLDGDSGLGLACACRTMRMAIEKCRCTPIAMVCVRNTHHLGPAGYFAHLAIEHGMIGLCMTGHFFGRGHSIGVAPLGTLLPMLSTNPLSFAAPCLRHAPFVLDMSTSVATINRIEMHGQEGRSIPAGWACDSSGNSTTDPAAARLVLPLGGTTELGGHKGMGLAMMVSILSGVLSGGWSPVDVAVQPVDATESAIDYDQPTMGHFFAAVRIDAFQPLDRFRAAMDAMIDALHAAPRTSAEAKVSYPGEIEHLTALDRSRRGIPVSDHLFNELQTLAASLDLEMPQSTVA